MNGNLTSTWQRFSVTYTSLFAGNYNAYFAADQNNTAEIEVWGMQVELGSTATPYYPVSRPVTTTWKDLTSNNYNATLGISTLSSVEVLVVGGGGGAGFDGAGGGGGGGVIYNPNFSVTQGTTYTVTVGTGGAASVLAGPNQFGANGGNSIFGSLVALGGGGGGSKQASGLSGGSGGGVGHTIGFNPGPGTPGQGFSGGNSVNEGGGGGGGAGSPGTNASNSPVITAGNGGNGILNSISGTATYYGAGGAGGSWSGLGGLGGLGGGGNGGGTIVGTGFGTPGTGFGAGGAANGNLTNTLGCTSGAGFQGIVIVRYPGRLQKATGGIVTVVDNFTIHTFTSGTSTFVPYNFISPKYSTTAGGCLTFNGIDQIVDLNVSAYDLGIRRHATFSGWMMTNLGGAYLLSDWDNLGMTLRFNDLNSADFYIYGSNRRITAAYTFTVNVWYNIVGVMDGANMYMYINGTLVGTQTLGEDIGASSRTLKISARGDYSPPSSLQRVGSLQIYNRALSAAEVTNNFNALKGRYGL